MKKITSLTDAQKAKFPEYVDKWTKIGLCTEPADRVRAENAIRGLYTLANLKEPKVIWLPCPISAAIATVVFAKLVKTNSVGSAVDSAVGSAVDSAVCSAVGSAVGSAGRSFFGGSLWCGYEAWADYFNRELSISIDRNYLDLCESSGYYWTLDSVCFASERPREINLDAEGRLHSESGMSISYLSGWGLWHWHGVQIPGEWITRQPPTAKEAITWPNIEQRRAACEIVKWNNVLSELNSTVIDDDGDPEIGILLEAEIPDSGKERFLQVKCGTGRSFVLPVPKTMRTAIEANAWTYGLDVKDFQPEIRT